MDGSNDIIVTGVSGGDYATIKYASAGTPLWTNRCSWSFNTDYASAVAVDRSNNVVVTGYAAVSGGTCDYATIKYSSAGVPLWTNRYDGGRDDQATAVGLDSSNNVVVTGFSDGGGTSYDWATVKYSSTGVALWTNRYSGPGYNDDRALALAVDHNDNVIAAGCSTESGSFANYLTIKYSGAGTPLWTNRYDGSGGTDWAEAVAVDGNNSVIVGGYCAGRGDDFATIKYVCVPEPLLTTLPTTNGIFQLRVNDLLQPGTLVIEAATNLAGWAPVFTNTTPTNVLLYTDPDASTRPTRFYRAFQFPQTATGQIAEAKQPLD